MKHFRNFLAGVRQALVIAPEAEYIYPTKHGFLQDHTALKGDCNQIVSGLGKNTKRYGKQVNSNKS